MAISLQTFASADTNYIGKHNSNYSIIQAAINSLQLAQSGGANPAAVMAALLAGLFKSTTTRIGPSSYDVTSTNDTTDEIVISSGAAYRQSGTSVVSLGTATTIDFTGQSAGTHYIDVDSTGIPFRSDDLSADTLYSVEWTGTAFGDITNVALVLGDATEDVAARGGYETLGERLDAVAGSVKTVGCSFDTELGIKGYIQVPFAGTIVGWSVIADDVGDITIDVYKKVSDPPPDPPAIPTDYDIISASAPIELSGAQSAAVAAAGVSTWTTQVDIWDVFAFEVMTLSGVTKGTAYLLIQQ